MLNRLGHLSLLVFASLFPGAGAVIAVPLEATCDGPIPCTVELSGKAITTSKGFSISSDNVIGWSLVNATQRGNGIVFKPRQEDYRFLVKYFDASGERQLTQIGFFNFTSAQSFASSLELLTGLAPNHDQSGATTKCTYAGKGFYSGTTLADPAVRANPLEKLLGIGAGAAMSPGSQMRALTANSARANSNTMAAGSSTERKTFTGWEPTEGEQRCSHCLLPVSPFLPGLAAAFGSTAARARNQRSLREIGRAHV